MLRMAWDSFIDFFSVPTREDINIIKNVFFELFLSYYH